MVRANVFEFQGTHGLEVMLVYLALDLDEIVRDVFHVGVRMLTSYAEMMRYESHKDVIDLEKRCDSLNVIDEPGTLFWPTLYSDARSGHCIYGVTLTFLGVLTYQRIRAPLQRE